MKKKAKFFALNMKGDTLKEKTMVLKPINENQASRPQKSNPTKVPFTAANCNKDFWGNLILEIMLANFHHMLQVCYRSLGHNRLEFNLISVSTKPTCILPFIQRQ